MRFAMQEMSRALRPSLICACCSVVVLAGAEMPAAAQPEVALERFEVQIWPDYDKPAALVMYRARLAADTPIPSKVKLRIPAAVGEPHAVAYTGEGGRLLLAKHTRTVEGEWAVVEISAQSHDVQLEYYAPILALEGTRQVRYVWPGDLQVATFVYGAMQPAAAAKFSVTPPAAEQVTRADGLIVHTADLGAVASGKEVKVEITYESDGTLSAKRKAPAPPSKASAPPRPAPARRAAPATPIPPAAKVGGGSDDWLIWLILGLSVAAGAIWVLFSARGKGASA